METTKEKLFAEWVESFNQKRQTWYIGWLCGMFFWINSTFFPKNGWRDGNGIGNWIVGLVGMGVVALVFSISFSKSYTQIDGKYAKREQSIWDVVYRMPFSINAYYKVVEKVFRKIIFWSGIGIFLLMEIVIFLDITWSDYGWDFCFHDALTGANICRNIFFGILIAAFVTGVMYLGFYICKRRNIKYFQNKVKGKISCVSTVKKESEKEQERAEKRKKIHTLLMANEETRKDFTFEKTKSELIASALSTIFALIGMVVWLWASFEQDGNFTTIFENTNRILLAFPGISMICNGYSAWRKSKVAGVAAIFAGVCMGCLILLR